MSSETQEALPRAIIESPKQKTKFSVQPPKDNVRQDPCQQEHQLPPNQ